MRFAISCLLLALLSAGICGVAHAQAQSSEAGDCSILSPIPDSEMRGFDTDRPTKSNVPYTTDCGHFQYETDLANYSYQESGGIVTETLLAPNPTLKLGVSGTVDVEINISPFEQIRVRSSRTDRVTTVSGQGDLYARVKINLWGDYGGNSALTLIPWVKAPTAASGLGNGAVEGGMIAPLAFSLPAGVTLLFDPEVDVLKDSSVSGYHANYVNLVNASRMFAGNLTVYAELWSDMNADPAGTVHEYSFDSALAWLPRPNLQLDIGVNAGLNTQTPSYQVYVGASQRF